MPRYDDVGRELPDLDALYDVDYDGEELLPTNDEYEELAALSDQIFAVADAMYGRRDDNSNDCYA